MPTYDYKCIQCGHIQEEFHFIKKNPNVKCEKCNAKSKKIFSVNDTNFILKGNDWPSRDSRMKTTMTAKNSKMKKTMKDRENAGEGVSSIKDLK